MLPSQPFRLVSALLESEMNLQSSYSLKKLTRLGDQRKDDGGYGSF